MEKHTEPRTLIEMVAATDWLLAQVLEPLDRLDRDKKIQDLFVKAYHARRDDEACLLYGWFIKSTGELNASAPPPYVHFLAARFVMGSDFGKALSEKPDMPTTDAQVIQSIAVGLSSSSWDVCMRSYEMLAGIFTPRTHARKAIVEAVRHACQGLRQSRLLELLALNPPTEIATVFLHALVRNADRSELTRGIEYGAILDGCLPSAHAAATEHLGIIRNFDEKVRMLVRNLREDPRGWIFPTDEIEVSYALSPNLEATVKLRLVMQAQVASDENDYLAISKMVASVFATWCGSWPVVRGDIEVSVMSGGMQVHFFRPSYA